MSLRRVLRIGMVGVLVVLAIMTIGVSGTAWWSLPPRHQAGIIPGLQGPVNISFDQDGVPRLRAGSDLDAAAALGFVHARDRMFQMELMRRVASGRLSEIAGGAGLKLDTLTRTLGLRRHAEADLPLLPAHTRALLDAYSRGVNAWIAARGRFAAPEFILLGAPEPWTPVDCLLWAKTMSLYLSGNYRDELARMSLSRRIRPSQIDQLWPGEKQPASPQASLTPAAASPGAGPPWTALAANLLHAMPSFPDPFTLPHTASNEWAVDGAHSATGKPLLAGDPHLSFGLPSIWYLARIDTPGSILAGATAPGIPFVVIGRNAHIAWTFTTTGTDTQDLFIETPVDSDDYASPSGPLPYVTRDETIHVLGAPDHLLHVRETRHGPVISDIEPSSDDQVIAVDMAALAPADSSAAGLDALDQAGSVSEALAAAPRISSPNQNLLVADANGIGVAVTGRVPIRLAGDGESPVDGASGTYDWIGFASGAELPHIVHPTSGRLVNANERIAPVGFPVFLGRDGFGDWRARRIRTLLDIHPRPSVADFVAMQNDTLSLYALQLMPVLRTVRPTSTMALKALDLLGSWDGRMDRDRPQPLIFNAWMQHFNLALLDHEGVPVSSSGPRLEFVASVLTGSGQNWCEGDCSPLLASSLEQTVIDLARVGGSQPTAWRWGPMHRATFAHPILGQLPVIGRLTTRRIDAAGDDATLDRGGMANAAIPDYDDLHGASYRGVYDLADLDRSRFIVAPGQSGNLFSPHATDLMRRWRDGVTVALTPRPDRVQATIALMPATGP